MISSRVLAAAVFCSMAVCACSRGVDQAKASAPEPMKEGDAYVVPPRIIGVTATADGGLAVEGRASPDGRIRAVSGAGRSFGATPGKDGRFMLELPKPGGPVLLTFAQERGGGLATKAEGWLFVPPDGPSHAVILRPGAPALPLNPQAGLIATVDYDAGGGAAVGGHAPPGQLVSLSLDGGASVEAKADDRGDYGARFAGERVAPGEHVIRASLGRQTFERRLTLMSPAGQQGVMREADGWRVFWPLSGAEGGVQSTLVVTGPERP